MGTIPSSHSFGIITLSRANGSGMVSTAAEGCAAIRAVPPPVRPATLPSPGESSSSTCGAHSCWSFTSALRHLAGNDIGQRAF
jgi:hypothetical protein